MLITVHFLVGAAIGKYIGQTWLIIILAILSHYILDAIPHTKMSVPKGFIEKGFRGTKLRDWLWRGLEPILGAVLVLILIYLNKDPTPLLIGAFFAGFPDLINFLGWRYKSMRKLRKIVPYPGNLFYKEAKSLVIGIGVHIVFGIAAVLALIFNLV